MHNWSYSMKRRGQSEWGLSVVTWNMQQYDHMLINIHRLMFLAIGSIQELTCLLPCYCTEVIHAEPAIFPPWNYEFNLTAFETKWKKSSLKTSDKPFVFWLFNFRNLHLKQLLHLCDICRRKWLLGTHWQQACHLTLLTLALINRWQDWQWMCWLQIITVLVMNQVTAVYTVIIVTFLSKSVVTKTFGVGIM